RRGIDARGPRSAQPAAGGPGRGLAQEGARATDHAHGQLAVVADRRAGSLVLRPAARPLRRSLVRSGHGPVYAEALTWRSEHSPDQTTDLAADGEWDVVVGTVKSW